MGNKKGAKVNNVQNQPNQAEINHDNKFGEYLSIAKTYLSMLSDEYNNVRKNFDSDDRFLQELEAFYQQAKNVADSFREGGEFSEAEVAYKNFINAVDKADEMFDGMKAVDPDTKEEVSGVKAFKFLKGDRGKQMFDKMKMCCIAGSLKADLDMVQSNYSRVKKPLDNLRDKNGILDNLSNLLNDGDRIGRGSSEAYKEIQSEIKDLKKILKMVPGEISNKPLVGRYAMLMAKSISERCHQYLKEREAAELSCSVSSYKGKRIRIMHEVENRLNAFLSTCDTKKVMEGPDQLVNYPIPKEYKQLIERKLNNTTFNKELFAESRALNTARNMQELDEKQKRFASHPVTGVLAAGLSGEKGKKADFEKDLDIASTYITEFENDSEGIKKFGDPDQKADYCRKFGTLNQMLRANKNSSEIGLVVTKKNERGGRDDYSENTNSPKLNRTIAKACHKIMLDTVKELRDKDYAPQDANDMIKDAENIPVC